MVDLALATIAHNAPRWLDEQIRLLDRHLDDLFELTVFDSSTSEDAVRRNRSICEHRETTYRRLEATMHHEALNVAATELLAGDRPRLGFLDHDIFPIRSTRLVPLIDEAGFLGIGQRHGPTGKLYPWPGFVFFDREWLAGRDLDFTGIRGSRARDNGDTGSGLWPLFTEEDWRSLFRLDHGYGVLREPDSYGLQSFGYEKIGDWIHLTNGSQWMAIPDPEERERLAMDLLANL